MIFPRPQNSYAHHSIEPLSILTHYMFQLRSAYMGVAMMAFFHLYLKYTQPLFIQALMGLKNLYDAKVVAIHILGKPADGDLKRPFKVASMFGRMSTPSSSMRTGLKWFFLQLLVAHRRTRPLLQRQKRRLEPKRRSRRSCTLFLLRRMDVPNVALARRGCSSIFHISIRIT